MLTRFAPSAGLLRGLVKPRPLSISVVSTGTFADPLGEGENIHNTFGHVLTARQPSRSQAPFPRMLGRAEDERVLEVAMVGLPNAGKSTLMNRLVSDNVSAVSPKRNTTRRSVLAVLTHGDAQVCFMDTPGYVSHEDSRNFVRPLYTVARDAMHHVDLTMIVVDAVKRIDHATRLNLAALFTEAFRTGAEMAIVLNKVDLVDPKEYLLDRTEELLDIMEETRERLRSGGGAKSARGGSSGDDYGGSTHGGGDSSSSGSSGGVGASSGRGLGGAVVGPVGDTAMALGVKPSAWSEYVANARAGHWRGDRGAAPTQARGEGATVFMVSAKKDDGVEDVRNFLLLHAKPGPWIMEEGDKTDMDVEERIHEIFREQIFVFLHQEIPYRTLVRTRKIEFPAEGRMRIEVDFLVSSESHRRLVSGQLKNMIHKARAGLKETFHREALVVATVKAVKGKLPLT